MMTIQKPKRMWQKKKDYMRKRTIRGLRRKGKRILQSFDIGTDDGQQMIYQDGDQYFAGPNINAATTNLHGILLMIQASYIRQNTLMIN